MRLSRWSLFVLLSAALAHAALRDTQPDTWSGTDSLGRAVPVTGDVPAPRAGRFVGMFYFLWMQPSEKNHIYDITQIRAADGEHPRWGPAGAFHWWGQPQFGYYASDDPWVIRKHAQLISDAGVDVLFFDVTNALTYDNTITAVCDTFEKIRSEGGRTPQIAFITHTKTVETIAHLYESIYAANRYPDLWFKWLGKPLLLASPQGLPANVTGFFTLRESWAWTAYKGWFGDGQDKWPWLDNSPQKFGWHDSPKVPEELPVAVAQHPVLTMGRSYQNGVEPPPAGRRPEAGIYFTEQWTRALAVDPQFVFVTGWNEWMAQRFVRAAGAGPTMMAGQPLPVGGTFFVDEFSEEFSRDVEPMSGSHNDNYYYQLVSAIRQYKGVRALPPASPPTTIDIAGPFTQWKTVQPVYLDDLFDTRHRDHAGYDANMRYINDSGRNDLAEMRVTRDTQNVYFYVQTREPLTAPQGDDWMTLLISTTPASGQDRANWQGYDLLINRTRTDTACSIEHCSGGWNWRDAGQAQFRYEGNELQIGIPRALLGSSTDRLHFDFKWTDHAIGSGNAADFLDHGDVAPNGRFNYRYRE